MWKDHPKLIEEMATKLEKKDCYFITLSFLKRINTLGGSFVGLTAEEAAEVAPRGRGPIRGSRGGVAGVSLPAAAPPQSGRRAGVHSVRKDGGQLSLFLPPLSPLWIRRNLKERFLVTRLESGLRTFGQRCTRNITLPQRPSRSSAGGFPERP